ncbi:MAG: tetratricopeptide repeat protein [Methylovulum sp.]|nr:tetratricopeptide repeat protein [Methylovulum sp.]
MLIFKLFSVILLVLFAGCAATPEQSGKAEKPITPIKIVQPKPKVHQKEAGVSIDGDVMFMLLTAELAGQRGHYDIALEGYLEAAKRVKDPRFAERAAMIAMYMKDAAKTNEAVNLWLQEEPRNQAARKIAVLSALIAGNKAAAVEHLDAMLAIDPAGFEKSVLELVSTVQKEGKSDVVYEALDALSAKHPNNATIYFIESLLATQMDKKALAEANIQKALDLQPDWDKALVFKAQLAMLSGDLNKAIRDLKAALVKRPADDKIKKMLGQLLIKAKDYPQAAQVYQSLVKANSEDSESQFALGLVYLQLAKDEQAEDIFTALLDKPKWEQQASFYLGKLEEKQGNPGKALNWYNKIDGGPIAFDAGVSAVSLLTKEKRFDEAGIRLDALKKTFPKQQLRLLLMQAELLNQQARYQQAFNLLNGAVVEYPDETELLYARALMAERVGKLDVLEADLKKILAANPDNAEALNALGYTLVDKTDRYAEAEQYLLRALSLAPDEPVILDSYGWLQFKLGSLPKALDYLQRAYAKQKENEIAAHLAEVLWVLGKKDEAKKLFREAIESAPIDEYLLDFQRRVLNKAQ